MQQVTLGTAMPLTGTASVSRAFLLFEAGSQCLESVLALALALPWNSLCNLHPMENNLNSKAHDWCNDAALPAQGMHNRHDLATGSQLAN